MVDGAKYVFLSASLQAATHFQQSRTDIIDLRFTDVQNISETR